MLTIGPKRRATIEKQLVQKLPDKWGASIRFDMAVDRATFTLWIERFDGRSTYLRSKGARMRDIDATTNAAMMFARPY